MSRKRKRRTVKNKKEQLFMKKSAPLTTRLLLWTALFTLVLIGLVEGLCYFLLPAQPPLWWPAEVRPDLYKEITMIIVDGVIVFWMLLLWLVIRRVCGKAAKAEIKAPAESRKSELKKEDTPAEQAKRLHHDKKLFLHLVSVLQTEGRLLDFFNEDLDQFDDAQIGAAARGVHERCKQALAKYVVPAPLSGQAEGAPVTVSSGFDPGAFRLSGNVTGDPPFEGKLIHKGWRAERLNMPDFAFSGDPEIIAPMEVKVE